jgi:hypothetical protein
VRRPSRLFWVGVAAAAGVAAVALRPGGPEAWARRAAPALAEAWTQLGDAVPWPWTPPLAAALLGVAVLLAARARGRGHAAARLLGLALLIGAGFEATWGLNARLPAAPERLGLVTAHEVSVPADDAAMRAMARRLPDVVRREAPSGPLNEAAAFAAIRDALRELAPGRPLPARVKVLPGPILGPWGVAGVISPWTLEVHVDAGLPPWTRTAVAAHELAHVAGFASESDAEFVGLLAALRADHPHARYAGALRAWAWLPADLRDARTLPPRARRDLAALREARDRRVESVSRVAWAIYDRWLQSRGHTGGTAGYAEGPRWLARAGAADWW